MFRFVGNIIGLPFGYTIFSSSLLLPFSLSKNSHCIRFPHRNIFFPRSRSSRKNAPHEQTLHYLFRASKTPFFKSFFFKFHFCISFPSFALDYGKINYATTLIPKGFVFGAFPASNTKMLQTLWAFPKF